MLDISPAQLQEEMHCATTTVENTTIHLKFYFKKLDKLPQHKARLHISNSSHFSTYKRIIQTLDPTIASFTKQDPFESSPFQGVKPVSNPPLTIHLSPPPKQQHELAQDQPHGRFLDTEPRLSRTIPWYFISSYTMVVGDSSMTPLLIYSYIISLIKSGSRFEDFLLTGNSGRLRENSTLL